MYSLYSSVQVPRDSSQKLISSKTFINTMKKYIKSTVVSQCVDMPKNMLEFIDDDGFKATQHVFDNSKGFLGMYENARKLTFEINSFGDFIGNYDYLDMAYCEPYNHTVIVFKSLKDEEFIHRKDVFPLIQSLILQSVPDMRHDITISMLSLFLRNKEKTMAGGYTEFIKYSDDLLLNFSNILHSDDFKKKLNDAPKGKRLGPFNKKAALKLWFECTDLGVLDETASSMSGFYNQDVYWKWQVTLEAIEKFMASRDDLFSSDIRYRTVRLFEDGTDRFVFGNELANALDKKYTEKNDLKMMIVQDQFLERLAHIDFIRTPIGRSKTRAIPIITPNCHFAILSSDALIELLHQLIDMEVFPCSTQENVKLALNLVETLFCVNGKTKTCCSFFTYDSLANSVHKILLKDATTAKTVRHSAFSNGFTLKDLKDLIESIELNTVFPNILQYAPMAYKYVNDCKATEILKTSDFFKCLKVCQMMSIMEMAPNLRTYLHDQKACNHVIGIGCTQCPQILRRVFASRYNIVEDFGIEKEELNEMPDDREVRAESEPVAEVQEVHAKKNKKVKAKKEPSVDKPSTSSSCDEGVESADEVVVNKQSNNCVKCFRTSERCNQVTEKLKQMSKIQKENEKKISKQAMEIEEKNAKILELMAQLAALQSSQQVPKVVSKIPELTQEMKDILSDFQTKRNAILNENPVSQLSQKVVRLKSKATNKNDKLGAQAEYKKFCNNYEKYMNALEMNINRIQSRTQNITSSDLLKVPEFPTLSSGFLEAYERIVTKPEEEAAAAAAKKKKKEEEREKECQICYNDMTSSEETLKCPHCPKTYHSSCISDWINVSPTCPNCRGKFLNPVDYPPLS